MSFSIKCKPMAVIIIHYSTSTVYTAAIFLCYKIVLYVNCVTGVQANCSKLLRWQLQKCNMIYLLYYMLFSMFITYQIYVLDFRFLWMVLAWTSPMRYCQSLMKSHIYMAQVFLLSKISKQMLASYMLNWF